MPEHERWFYISVLNKTLKDKTIDIYFFELFNNLPMILILNGNLNIWAGKEEYL